MNSASAYGSSPLAWSGLFGRNGLSPWHRSSNDDGTSALANRRRWKGYPWGDQACRKPCDRLELSSAKNRDAKSTEDTSSGQNSPETQYIYKKSTQVNVGLKLNFNYSVLKKIAQKISDGEMTTEEAIEELVRGHFGLSTAIKASGKEVVEEGYDPTSAIKSTTNSISQSAESITIVEKSTGDGYSYRIADRETESTRERLQQVIREGFTRTVKSFDMRYSRDTSFDYSHFTRFLHQTSDMNDVAPENVESYIESTGTLVDSAPEQSLSEFFDLVDKYLAGSEEEMLAAADKFLSDLASKMALPDGWVESARSMTKSSIESFFNSVKNTVAEAKALVTPDAGVQPVPGNTADTVAKPAVSPINQQTTSSMNLVA
jgi:hypothetical protein